MRSPYADDRLHKAHHCFKLIIMMQFTNKHMSLR